MLLNFLLLKEFSGGCDFVLERLRIKILLLFFRNAVSSETPVNGLPHVPVFSPSRGPVVRVNAIRAGFFSPVIIEERESVNVAVSNDGDVIFRSEVVVVEEVQESGRNLRGGR